MSLNLNKHLIIHNTKNLLKTVSSIAIPVGGVFSFFSYKHVFFPEATSEYFLTKDRFEKMSSTSVNNENNKAWNTHYEDNVSLRKASSKNVKSNSADEILKKIKDYSVRFEFPCDSGTAWILDHEMIEEKKVKKKRSATKKLNYPKKWFFATNAHVVSNYIFKNNPYQQMLPVRRNLNIATGFNSISNNRCQKSLNNEDSSLYIYKESDEKNKNSDEKISVYYTEIKDPKLFYVPVNFLGDRYDSEGKKIYSDFYYKDFAVVEVNFEKAESAQKITGDFYNKYSKKTQKENLNLFDDELMQKYSVPEMKEKNYYMGGYPAMTKENLKNYLFQTNEMNFLRNGKLNKAYSKLSYWKSSPNNELNLKNKFGQKIIGHVDVGDIDRKYKNTTTNWNNKNLYNWGYNYLIDNIFYLKAGASGSLVSDDEGNILGLYRMHDKVQNQGFVEPLRSSGIYQGSKIIVPPYDLIKGSEWQKSSYKQQLEKYHPSLNTFLKSKGWK